MLCLTLTELLNIENCMQWTTDQDLQDALASIGVTDLVNIKFHENRTNGQSKGSVIVISVWKYSSNLLCMLFLPKIAFCVVN